MNEWTLDDLQKTSDTLWGRDRTLSNLTLIVTNYANRKRFLQLIDEERKSRGICPCPNCRSTETHIPIRAAAGLDDTAFLFIYGTRIFDIDLPNHDGYQLNP